jgi:phage terminase large subunit GpA-like protein
MKQPSPFLAGFAAGITPDPDVDLAEWSDRHRVLSAKGSSEPGPYRIARTPYLIEIAKTLSPQSPIERVVFMKSAQVGASELGFNWLGYIMSGAGQSGPVMMVQPTTETAERVSKQRIAPMIEETPVLKQNVSAARVKDSSNTMLLKEWPGGVLVITGANSGTGLRSTPVKSLFFDEADAAPADVGGEGDPLELAEKRTTTFARRKIFIVSTPTVKDFSRIEREFLQGDQRRYFVPCPHCDAFQWLKFKQIKWDDGRPETARYICEECSGEIFERHKTEMLARGQWRATAPGDGRTTSFHISSLYSPVGWKSWEALVREFLKAKSDPALLKTFLNTSLGETWEENYSARINSDSLMSRTEFYEPNVAPLSSVLLTAGVDVQDNRLAISVYAWARGEEAWLVSHQEIFGDPARADLWKQLDAVLLRPYRHELGGELMISAAAIDSGGHFTSEVYQYTRERRGKHIIAVKGQSQRGKPPIGKATKVDLNFRGQTLKHGAEVYPMGSDTIKTTLYARFKLDTPGEGYYHFYAGLGPEYFEQLVAEKQVTRFVRGQPVREWFLPSGKRNEALDCAVMGYAALQYLYTRHDRRTIWDQYERKLCAPVKSPPPPSPASPEVKPGENGGNRLNPAKPQNTLFRGRKNFLTSW